MSDIIQFICGELTTSYENEVMKAVRQVGIHVNKEELLKALELADKLVWCKDCIYQRKKWHEDKRKKEGGYWIIYCGNEDISEFLYGLGQDNDYCSYGKRTGMRGVE